MVFPSGFNYVQGSWTLRRVPVASAATFLARIPLVQGGDGTFDRIDPAGAAVSIAGISMSRATDSIYGSEILMGVPGEDTIFAVKVQTGVATSALTGAGLFELEADGTTGLIRVDTDSTTTPIVKVVPRGDGTIDALSEDSTVYVQILKDRLDVFGINA